MPNLEITPLKDAIVQTTANETKSYEIPLSFPKGTNCYFLKSLRCQIDDFDAIADGDSWTVQISYKDLNALSLETIDQDDEIETIGEDFKVLGTNGPIVKNVRGIASKGELFQINKNVVKTPFYLNFDCVGQDAAESLHFEMEGKYDYINPKDKVRTDNNTSTTNYD